MISDILRLSLLPKYYFSRTVVIILLPLEGFVTSTLTSVVHVVLRDLNKITEKNPQTNINICCEQSFIIVSVITAFVPQKSHEHLYEEAQMAQMVDLEPGSGVYMPHYCR